MSVGNEAFQITADNLRTTRIENEQLRELITHMWVHSNYTECGYFQMTTEQKDLFKSITAEAGK